MSAWLDIHPNTGKPPQARMCNLTCCCCGNYHRGRQWHNRDDEYGICPGCATDEVTRGTPPERMKELYGFEGIHYITTTAP